MTLVEAIYSATEKWCKDHNVPMETYEVDGRYGLESNTFRWRLRRDGVLRTEFLKVEI